MGHKRSGRDMNRMLRLQAELNRFHQWLDIVCVRIVQFGDW
jgi:hypothetical protein